MPRRSYNLPPLTTLVAFEAAARQGSFKRAADDLNVTPGAVSHQIKALEGELGAGLFERIHRGVTLTEDGRDLMAVLQASFQDISQVIDRIRRPTKDRAITISATTAVSALWLTPRITRFWRENPDVRINQFVSDAPLDQMSPTDLSISYGNQAGRGAVSQEIFTDTLVPLADQELAVKYAGGAVDQIAKAPLIHLNAEDHRWTTWRVWFDALGYQGALSRGARVNNYMIALQAAQDGAGIVLGWHRLVRPYLDNGSLKVIDPHYLPAPESFFLHRSAGSALDPQVTIFADWLLRHID